MQSKNLLGDVSVIKRWNIGKNLKSAVKARGDLGNLVLFAGKK
jgi:hypothetical protein